MSLEIALDVDEEWDSSRSWEPLVRKAVEADIAQSDFPQLASARRLVEVSIRLTGDAEVRSLNAKWRGKDHTTNVLSFPLAEIDQFTTENVVGAELLLGDIVLARGVCEREASEKGLSLEQHASHLIVHGTLHLLGYDHQSDTDGADMEAREVSALETLGIANPYEVAA
jgi:probable rRNA maturation factor